MAACVQCAFLSYMELGVASRVDIFVTALVLCPGASARWEPPWPLRPVERPQLSASAPRLPTLESLHSPFAQATCAERNEAGYRVPCTHSVPHAVWTPRWAWWWAWQFWRLWPSWQMWGPPDGSACKASRTEVKGRLPQLSTWCPRGHCPFLPVFHAPLLCPGRQPVFGFGPSHTLTPEPRSKARR